MEWHKAKELADKVCSQLYPYCEELYIAGSIRRGCSQVSDIEIVCIPQRVNTTREEKTLFDDLPVLVPGKTVAVQGFVDRVNMWPKKLGDPKTGKYTRRQFNSEMDVDIFMCERSNVGLILAIRTGSTDFCKYLMQAAVKGGYKSVDGYLHRVDNGDVVPVTSEDQLFQIIGIPFVHPQKRNAWPR